MVLLPWTATAAYRVSERVNKPQNQGPELIAVID
jgi:putative SOS response-associated peptidase YedK